jgi:sulfite reductase (NADPH) flavoprotein alpha-component
MATFLSRRQVNKPGSEKETWHIEFDLRRQVSTMLSATPFGVFAANDLGLVDQIIAMLGASHMTEVSGKPLREVLLRDVAVARARHAVRTDLFRDRRRAAREGAGAGLR